MSSSSSRCARGAAVEQPRRAAPAAIAAANARGFPLGALAAAALYGAVMAAFYPYRDVFAFDTDEGINAIKALLVDRGYALYADIWSDQPPLFTLALRAWLDAFGWDVNTGRLLVLLCAAAAVFALYDTVRLLASEPAAVLATALLATSAYFPRLSVSIMIGLPAIALALLALWSLCRRLSGGGPGWLALAALFMGSSLACKLFTAVLLPVFAIWLIATETAGRCGRWAAGALWVLASALVGLALLWTLAGPEHLVDLVAPHLASRRAPAMQSFGAQGLLVTAAAEWPLTVLALGSYLLIARERRWRAAVLPAWALAATAALLTHVPIWYHHQLLLTVPHCAATGIAVAALFAGHRSRTRSAPALRALAVALIAAQLAWTALYGPRLPSRTLSGVPARVLTAMRQLADVTRVVFATEPMYAFRAGYEVPPRLAVLSHKRLLTDAALFEEIRAVFESRPPQQVVLGNDDRELDRAVRDAMGGDYRLLLTAPGVSLFARRAILER
ncbi:MAG: glycosyltransferase family 39 protein [Candidatus Binatia bacterium]